MNIRADVLTLKKMAVLLIITIMCVAAAELAFRSFWFYQFDIPFFSPDRILYAYYPELAIVDNDLPSRNNKYYDVLLIGGSTLHPNWGYVEQLLRRQLNNNGYRNARIYNLAMPAHTSRDSLLKYAAMDKARFDLVVFYHGMNEVRANNVPPALFRNNYDHYSWYESANALSFYHSKAIFAIPYSLHYLWLRILQIANSDDYVPTHTPREDWTQYGQYARSDFPFKQNIEDILNIASRRKDRVLLLTFANYVPQNYSLEHFQQKRLDYGLHKTPIEIWGERANVVATVALHNEAVKEIATVHKEVYFIDLNLLIPKSGRFFDDPCHLTLEGSAIFADNVFKIILRSSNGHTDFQY